MPLTNGYANVCIAYTPKQEIDTELHSVENQSDRWVAEDTNSFYYDIVEKNDTKNIGI